MTGRVRDTVSTARPSERTRRDVHPPRLGAYRLFERLGSGGQAFVYRAQRIGDPDACDVALKRLHPHLTDDDAAVRSFGREARIAYLLDHPVIRRVFSLCREPGELFMIMEYVNGVSVNNVLKRASAARRHLPVHGILALLHRLCGALHHAHGLVDERGAPAGLVHRDVSPSNLIVTPAGRLKLIDMGIARSQSLDHATNSGLIKGKYGYMAPEVMWNAPFDRRADVFSTGVVAWELLTACKLFPVRSLVELERVRARPIEPPSLRNPLCPVELDAVVLRALATDPADRWATCAEIAEVLQDVAARLGRPLTDGAIAELTEVPVDHDSAPGPTPSPPRSRMARGTPPELPVSRTTHVLSAVPPVDRRCRRCRRSLVLGSIGGALATLMIGLSVIAALQAPAPDAAVLAAPPGPVPGPLPVPVPVPGPVPVPVPVPLPLPVLLPEPEPVPEPVPAPVDLDASAVTRLDGAPPRSRSSSAAFRARLCIDAAGAVQSAELLDGPRRLERRITRALLRWRYQPHLDHGGARPACFEVESRLEKMPRRR